MLCFVFAALVVILDQFFKRWILLTVELHGHVNLIPGVIELTHFQNTGAAFSILEDKRWLLAGISLVAAVLLVFILLRYTEGFWGTIGLAAVLGGTVGNLIDRVFQGFVVDMFRPMFIKNFPVFNVADMFLTLGFATFCIHFLITSVNASKDKEELTEPVDDSAEEYGTDDQYDMYDIPENHEIPDFDSYSDMSDTKIVPIRKGSRKSKSYSASQPERHKDIPEQDGLGASSGQDDLYEPAPGQDDLYEVAPGQDGLYEASPEQDDLYGASPEQDAQYEAAQKQSGLYEAGSEQRSYYKPEPDLSDDLTAVLNALDSLESELGSIDEFDTDALLREYGFEDNDDES